MKKPAFLFTVAAAAALLISLPSAKAVSPMLSLVTPGDTFSFDVLGYNTASGTGYFVVPDSTATFGATTTFTAAGFDGQNYTITSGEVIGATTTTDTFTITTPANFVTDTTINGLTITGLEFDLGNANSGGYTVDLLVPITTYTATGSVIYNASTKQTLTPGTTLSNNGLSYAGVEGIQAGTSAINQFTVHSFTYAITYPNVVPEPSTWAMMGLGFVAGAVVVRRRHLAV